MTTKQRTRKPKATTMRLTGDDLAVIAFLREQYADAADQAGPHALITGQAFRDMPAPQIVRMCILQEQGRVTKAMERQAAA